MRNDKLIQDIWIKRFYKRGYIVIRDMNRKIILIKERFYDKYENNDTLI